MAMRLSACLLHGTYGCFNYVRLWSPLLHRAVFAFPIGSWSPLLWDSGCLCYGILIASFIGLGSSLLRGTFIALVGHLHYGTFRSFLLHGTFVTSVDRFYYVGLLLPPLVTSAMRALLPPLRGIFVASVSRFNKWSQRAWMIHRNQNLP